MVERSGKRNRGSLGRVEATRLQERVTKDLGVLDPGPGSTCPKSGPTPTPVSIYGDTALKGVIKVKFK